MITEANSARTSTVRKLSARRLPALRHCRRLVPVGWFIFPVALQTVVHPTDALGLEHYLQGEAVPRTFTAQAVTAGEGYALVALAVLVLLQLVGTVLFYRPGAG